MANNQSTPAPAGFVEVTNEEGAKVLIPRHKAVRALHFIETTITGIDILSASDRTIYGKGKNGNLVRVNGKKKQTKAEQKAAKKAKWRNKQ